MCIKDAQGQPTKFSKFVQFIKPVLESGLAGAGAATSPSRGAAFGQGFLGAQQFQQQKQQLAEQKMMREQQARTSGLQESLLKTQVAEAQKTPQQRLAELVEQKGALQQFEPPTETQGFVPGIGQQHRHAVANATFRHDGSNHGAHVAWRRD